MVSRRALVGLTAAALVALCAALFETCRDSAPMTPENLWGPFEGRVVDSETGAGIPGAAVIVFWKMNIPNPIEGHEEFDGARWAVTDTDGSFAVPPRNPPWSRFLFTRRTFLSCVAPSYLPYEFTPKYDPRLENARLRPGAETIRMHRAPELTREEKLRRHSEFTANNLFHVRGPIYGKVAEEINRKRAAMGLRPIRLESGELE